MCATRRNIFLGGAATMAGLGAPWVWRRGPAQAAPATIADPRFTVPVIDPLAIPKFVSGLPVPGTNFWDVIDLSAGGRMTLETQEVNVPILPESFAGPTPTWGYRRAGPSYDVTYLGPTILARSGNRVDVTYDYTTLAGTTVHLLRTGNGAASVVDKTLHGTDGALTRDHEPEPEVRFIAHLHGGKNVAEDSDGYAEAWVTPDRKTYQNSGYMPPVRNKATLSYPNAQDATLLWYHDHALGITRLNVYAGLAAAYLLRDQHELAFIGNRQLPSDNYEVPLIIQDRMFYPDGNRLAYPDRTWVSPAGFETFPGGVSTMPEFFGDVILVNGKAWPRFGVEPAKYRFRVLNGCNSRVLDLRLPGGVPWTILGTEGGFLNAPVTRSNLIAGPAERFDVIVDFSGRAGQTLTLRNVGAKKPFPKGTPPNPRTDGVVMQFVVGMTTTQGPITLPIDLRPGNRIPSLPSALPPARRVLLFEGEDAFGRVNPLLGTVIGSGPPFQGFARHWYDEPTETPRHDTDETWEIFNTTADTHPIHIHEVLFRVVDRQPISVSPPSDTTVSDIRPFGAARPREAYEAGFKDTVLAYPGQVTRVYVHFATQGRFNWHCHILEHEDHEMMRPYDIV